MLAIGELARRTNTKVQTIRYYESIDLVPQPPRSEGGQRRYDEAALNRLAFIRHARELGFGLDAIRDLLSLGDYPEQSCERADAIARDQLGHVERRIRRLQSLKLELERMLAECHGGRVVDCRVIEVLGDHNECFADVHDAALGV